MHYCGRTKNTQILDPSLKVLRKTTKPPPRTLGVSDEILDSRQGLECYRHSNLLGIFNNAPII
jgi:hypothetical protein